MKRTIIFCIIAFLTMLPFSVKAEEIIIDEDTLTCDDIVLSLNFNRTWSPRHESIIYYLGYAGKTGTKWLDAADSLWITTVNPSVTIMEISDPTEHDIDLFSLEPGAYNLWATYGGCIFSHLFHKRWKSIDAEALDNIPTEASTRKILRDGQLYIRREGKTYSPDGRITTCQ